MNKFWQWYERHYALNVSVAAFLFFLQLIHLYWLTIEVVTPHLFNVHVEPFSVLWRTIIVLVDYTEIPAILSTSFVYIHALNGSGIIKKKIEEPEKARAVKSKSLLYLIFLNSQWLHIFWITDEFVIEVFQGAARPTLLPFWLAWAAIAIDYLEIPVMIETMRRTWNAIKEKGR